MFESNCTTNNCGKMQNVLMIVVLLLLSMIKMIIGHGFLADPPARSSAWISDPDFRKCCVNYDHAAMSCGGFSRQWTTNRGKCSVCGEPFDQRNKEFSMGGRKYLGKIVRTYDQGSTIQVTVTITANHLGTFEFRICSLDKNPNQDATQECLDLNQLKIESGLMKYPIRPAQKDVRLRVTLPERLTCKHCVFQWKYRTGNSWGSSNGRSCLGCGRENEEFYGCADVSIRPRTTALAPMAMIKQEPLVSTNQRKCALAATFSQSFDVSSMMQQYCQNVCSTNCSTENNVGNELLYKNCQDTCSKLCICE